MISFFIVYLPSSAAAHRYNSASHHFTPLHTASRRFTPLEPVAIQSSTIQRLQTAPIASPPHRQQ